MLLKFKVQIMADKPIRVSVDSGSDCDLSEVIPSGAVNIHYREIDGTPGISVWTHKSRSWTPMAARTRSKQK